MLVIGFTRRYFGEPRHALLLFQFLCEIIVLKNKFQITLLLKSSLTTTKYIGFLQDLVSVIQYKINSLSKVKIIRTR